MGVAAENSSMIGVKSTEGAKAGKSCGLAAQIAKRALLDKKKSGDHTSSSKKRCICPPTTHPGSFRCRLHRATSSSPIKITKTKTTVTIGLSRFARDVSQEGDGSSLKPECKSEQLSQQPGFRVSTSSTSANCLNSSQRP